MSKHHNTISYREMVAAFERIAPGGQVIRFQYHIKYKMPSGCFFVLRASGNYAIDPSPTVWLSNLTNTVRYFDEIEGLKRLAFFVEKFKDDFEYVRNGGAVQRKIKTGP